MEASIQWVDPIRLICVSGWLRRLRRVECRPARRRGSLGLVPPRRSGGLAGRERRAAFRRDRWAGTSRRRSRESIGFGFFTGCRKETMAQPTAKTFKLYVERVHVPTLKPGGIVIM